MTSVPLHIEGMSCGHCLNAVRQALHGVAGAEVKSVQMGKAEVDVPGKPVIDALVAAVSEAGYRATVVAPA